MATSLKAKINVDKYFIKLLGKKQYQILADMMKVIIKTRTRGGVGVQDNRKKKLKALKKKTIKARERFPNLSSETTPSTSNLTRSGQLLDSLEGIGLKESYKVQIKTGRNDGAKNDDIIRGQEEMGRTFLELSGGEKQELAREAKALILKEIKKRQK